MEHFISFMTSPFVFRVFRLLEVYLGSFAFLLYNVRMNVKNMLCRLK